jgi:hypothetical protein
MYYNAENIIVLSGIQHVEHCGAEISKLELINNSKNFKPEGIETLLFQIGCFAFRSSARMDLFLNPNSSVMSVSLHSPCADL